MGIIRNANPFKMKHSIFTILLLATLTTAAQTNVVSLKFTEMVAIQDVAKEVKFNTYSPVWNDKGIFKIFIDAETTPIHLIIHTEDNKQFNLVVSPSSEKLDVTRYQWTRGDKVIDLSEEVVN